MNNARRASIAKIRKELEEKAEAFRAKLSELMAEFGEDFADLANSIDQERSDEEEYFENMPAGLQNGEKGDTAQSAIDSLERAHDTVTELADAINRETFDFSALLEIAEALGALEEAYQ